MAWSDVLSEAPLNEFAHVAIAFIVVFVAVWLLKGNFLWGAVLLSAFIGFVLVKEFVIDEWAGCAQLISWTFCGPGQSPTGAGIDVGFWLAGGLGGGIGGGLFPNRLAVGATLSVLPAVGILLWLGVV